MVLKHGGWCSAQVMRLGESICDLHEISVFERCSEVNRKVLAAGEYHEGGRNRKELETSLEM